jgi:uncharacterized protein (DUF1330 family)
MKYYSVAELEITDPSWVPEYVKNVTGLVERRGGRFLARTSKIEKVEGGRAVPQIYLIIEWPSREAAQTFYTCEEYRPYLQRRINGSKAEFLLIAGEDISKQAKMVD